MRDEKKPQSRRDNLVVQELDGETLIYDLEKNKAFCLNKTSALVWQACDGTRTVAEINDWLGHQLSSQTNEDIVWLALDQLSKEDLLENKQDIENKFAGLTRREAVRRIGLASVIALPLISALAVPSSVAAQTAPVCGQACSNNGQCAAPCPTCRQVAPGSGDKTCQV